MKKQTQHNVGDVVASSPWMDTSPSYSERLVLRLFKPKEYVVNHESRNENTELNHYFWGHYFSWTMADDDPDRLTALRKAWADLITRSAEFMESFRD